MHSPQAKALFWGYLHLVEDTGEDAKMCFIKHPQIFLVSKFIVKMIEISCYSILESFVRSEYWMVHLMAAVLTLLFLHFFL